MEVKSECREYPKQMFKKKLRLESLKKTSQRDKKDDKNIPFIHLYSLTFKKIPGDLKTLENSDLFFY